MDDAILIVGSQESAEIVGESVITCACQCGHQVKISGGLVIEGSNMQIIDEGIMQVACPKCGGMIALKDKVDG